MKQKLIIVLSALCLMTLVFAAGCAPEPLKAEYGDNIEEAVCFYKEEFDLEPFIKKQDGAKYTVYAEQIDSATLDTVELSVNGFKFTPTLNEEVLVRFTAERNGEKVSSKEIKMFLEVRVDKVVELFNSSWRDDGFLKEVNLDEKYIRSGRNTSTQVKWFGKEINDKNRFQYFATLLGDEITNYYSVTDWTDAVLTFWVYNPTEYEIEFAPIWSHNGAGIVLYSDARTIKKAKANGWTEIKYSLRYYGMTENFYYDDEVYFSYTTQVSYGIGYDETVSRNRMNQNWWTCRWGGRPEAGKLFSYNFYIDGFDIRNYDAAKDADLDHEYRGFMNQPITSGDGTIIDLDGNDGKHFSFEYKVTSSSGSFGVALIGLDWGTNYYGYFMFDADGMVDAYDGVTVTDLEDGFKSVSFDLEAVTCISGTIKPQVVKTFYIRPEYNSADVVVRNVG